MSKQIGGLGRWGIVLGLTTCLVGGVGATSADDNEGRVVLVTQKTQQKKKSAKKSDATSKEDSGMAPAAKGAAPAESSLSFKGDIAPILVANCLQCHSGNNPGLRNGKLDMTTFDKLMAGGKRGKDIVAGDPDSSTLVRMIKGEETPKMPPNNAQRGFATEAANKIETWVKQGAKLDAGVGPTDLIAKYASSVDDLRRSELSKLSTEERDKIAEQAGRDRWKQASKLEPELTTTKTGHFLLLSTLPKERATKLLQAMETQYSQANKLFSTSRTPVLNPTEKIGLYVFKDQAPFVEFVRSIEKADVEPGEHARAKLTVESPYIVAVDPAGGSEEASPAANRKAARSKKKTEEASGGSERSLVGLLTEQLVAATANKAGKPPRWVSLGLGAFTASHLEPGSPYYRNLRKETAETIRIGWQAKANGALGGEEKTETIKAVGFSLFEWMSGNFPKETLGNFVHRMLEGQGQLDTAIHECLQGTREEFLTNSELWLGERYGQP